MTGVRTCRVPSFGYLRINACLRLPTAFRSLPRPSSAISAKASSLCSYSLDLCSLIFAIKHLIGFPHCLGACKIFILESYKRNVLFILCAVFKERFSGTKPENGIVSGRDRTVSSICFLSLSLMLLSDRPGIVAIFLPRFSLERR